MRRLVAASSSSSRFSLVCFLCACLVDLANSRAIFSPASICKDGTLLPVAAYYLNRDSDTDRRKFMEEKLAAAKLRAIRVAGFDGTAGTDGIYVRERLLFGDDNSSELVKHVLAQTRCANHVILHGSTKGCFSKMVQKGNCSHVSAYGSPVQASATRGAKQCSGYIANFVGKMLALHRIIKDSLSGMYGLGGAHVMLLEDDSSPVPRWRAEYCEFVRTQPASGWDVAKLDSTRERNVLHTFQIAKRKRAVSASALPFEFVYSSRQLAAIRAKPLAFANITNQLAMPFGWGAAALVFHTYYAPFLYNTFNRFPIGSVDVHLLSMHWRGMLRLSMTDRLVFDSGNTLQGHSSIDDLKADDLGSFDLPSMPSTANPANAMQHSQGDIVHPHSHRAQQNRGSKGWRRRWQG